MCFKTVVTVLLFCIIIQIIQLFYNSHYVTMSTQFLVKQIENDSLTPSMLVMLDRYRCVFAMRIFNTPYTSRFVPLGVGVPSPTHHLSLTPSEFEEYPLKNTRMASLSFPRSLIWAVSDLLAIIMNIHNYTGSYVVCGRRELRLLLGELEYFSCLFKFTT